MKFNNSKCQICGKDFYCMPYKIKKGGGKSCSRKCQAIWQSKNRTGEKNPRWRGGKIKRTCLECGKDFLAHGWEARHGYGKFCNRKCYEKWRSKNEAGINSPTWKGGLIKQMCQNIDCKKEFKTTPSKIKSGWGRFCSRKCWGVWKSKNIVKEKSGNWKGGISPIYNNIRTCKKYLKWRQDCFIRDNFTCQKCGTKKSGGFHAHHIKKFSIILNDIKQKFPLLFIADIAENYPDLWSLENGITLCKKCHNETHKKTPTSAMR